LNTIFTTSHTFDTNATAYKRFFYKKAPPSLRPGRIFLASGDKNNELNLDEDWHSNIFYGWGFQFFCFQVRKFSGDGKNSKYFAVRIGLFDYFRWGQKLEGNFPPGMIFWPIFPVGWNPSKSVRRGCQKYTPKIEMYIRPDF